MSPTRDEYDLIQVVALGSGIAGLHALETHRLLTVESVRAVISRSSVDGVAAFTGPVIGIAAIVTMCALVSPYLTSFLLGAHPAVKIVAALVLIAPLATLMGMPFLRALARLNAVDPSLLPWAWGINGCASVIGAVLATLLAIHCGHTVVILAGVVLYAAAAALVARMAPRQA